MDGGTGLTDADWQVLYRRLVGPLYNVAYRYLWSSGEAEDVVHDAFLQVWARRASLRPDTADRYLWVSTTNLARKRRRWRRLRGLFDPGTPAPEPVDARTPESSLAAEQQRDGLRAAIDALPEKLRTVLLLTEFSDMDYAQIAAALGVPAGTVASRRHLAVARLRAALADEEASR